MKSIAKVLLTVCGLAVAASAMAADGKAVYEGTCVVCHGTGAVGAPKFGDKAAWAPRIATGKAALLSSALHGKNAMPPKGGNSNLTDAEVSAAIDYMMAAAK
jgi:cytochrome c5